jgi:hypothetical protein
LEGLATESTVLGEGLATESSVLREYSSTTLACLKEACNLNKSWKSVDSVANPLLGDYKIFKKV